MKIVFLKRFLAGRQPWAQGQTEFIRSDVIDVAQDVGESLIAGGYAVLHGKFPDEVPDVATHRAAVNESATKKPRKAKTKKEK